MNWLIFYSELRSFITYNKIDISTTNIHGIHLGQPYNQNKDILSYLSMPLRTPCVASGALTKYLIQGQVNDVTRLLNSRDFSPDIQYMIWNGPGDCDIIHKIPLKNLSIIDTFINHRKVMCSSWMINSLNHQQKSVFYIACETGNVNLVKLMLKNIIVDVNIQTNFFQYTPLMIAIIMTEFEDIHSIYFQTLKTLIKYNKKNNCHRFNINIKNYKGYSALSLAVKMNNDKKLSQIITKMLIDSFKNQININEIYRILPNYAAGMRLPKTLLDQAIESENGKTARFLIKRGAKRAYQLT